MPCAHKHIYNATSGDKKKVLLSHLQWCGFTKYGVIRKMGVVIVFFFSLFKLG